MQEVKRAFVRYEDFGAVGDGVHDDMPAIAACHAYANEHALPVVGTDGACYYIGGRDLTAVIMTDVFWGKAKFTVDDRRLENIEQAVFRVVSAHKPEPIALPPLSRGQRRLDLEHDGALYIRVVDEGRRVYIRKGLNMDEGQAASDSFVLDEAGNIVGDITSDYPTYTRATATRIDERPLRLVGGIFTTIANEYPSRYTYHGRNIVIERSRVTVEGLAHYVVGEGEHGAPYWAFLTVLSAYDITLRDCLLTPHKTYYTESKIPGRMVPMGSYDLLVEDVILIRLLRLRQTRDVTDTRYWGLMGSNRSKNVVMEDSVVSRFDAHMGVTNAKILRSTLGYAGVNLIGFGHFLMEDSRVIAERFLNLRDDYGSFFLGDVTVKHCTWRPRANGGSALCIVSAQNTGTHDFGYPCAMPHTIRLDGFTVEDADIDRGVLCAVLADYAHADTATQDKPYRYETTRKLCIKNLKTVTGRAVQVCLHPALYPNLTVEGEDM